MTDHAIEVRDLRKSYGPLEALQGISFEVRRGEVFGLLGPNGAGKTTTVEILEGYRDRDGGEVTVLGTDPASRDRDFRARIGIVLQSSGFYPRATVRESVELMAKAYPAPREVDETIALVGLEDKADARVKTLSGGQQRRLDLALALVGDPELIFLDEPTTGFDPAARRTAWGVIRSLKELGKTVVLTTHYLDEAQALSDRVAIVQAGPPDRRGPAGRADAGEPHLPRRLHARRRPHRDRHRRPDRAAAPADERGARARRAARGPDGHAAVARGRLPGADRRAGAPRSSPRRSRDEHRRAGLEPVPLRAPDVLAQPVGGVLQLHAAAALPRADRDASTAPTPTTSTCSCPASPAWR